MKTWSDVFAFVWDKLTQRRFSILGAFVVLAIYRLIDAAITYWIWR